MAHKILATAVLGLALGVAVSGQPQPRAFFKDYARLSIVKSRRSSRVRW